MKHDSIRARPPHNFAVRIATDAESNDFAIQDNAQTFARGLISVAPYRQIDKGLRTAARRAGTVLLDAHGNRATLVQLSDDDYFKFDYWLREWVEERASDNRRNQPKTLERRRYFITLLRMAWPREMTTLGKSSDQLGVERTHYLPPSEWEI